MESSHSSAISATSTAGNATATTAGNGTTGAETGIATTSKMVDLEKKSVHVEMVSLF